MEDKEAAISSLIDKHYTPKANALISKFHLQKKIDASEHFAQLIIILNGLFFKYNKRSVTTTELMDEIHIPRSYIYELLNFLVRAAVLQKVPTPPGGGKTKRYILIDENLLKECLLFVGNIKAKEKDKNKDV